VQCSEPMSRPFSRQRIHLVSILAVSATIRLLIVLIVGLFLVFSLSPLKSNRCIS
jgi:hypothetical protein